MVARDPECVPDEARARRLALRAIGAGFVAGWAILFAVQSWLERSQRDPDAHPEAAARALLVAGCAAGGFAAALGLWLAHVFLQVLRSGQFPPPGSHILRRARTVGGAPAVRLARAGFALAVLLIGCGLLLGVFVWLFHRQALA